MFVHIGLGLNGDRALEMEQGPRETHTICFTICLQRRVHDMFHDVFVSPDLEYTISFTICLFISPDFDGYRTPTFFNISTSLNHHMNNK